ncbi:MAG: ABC transporter permease [Chloroflexi bacterium]|nr:ABC transporter permease [Chloroflexota bacterium]MCY3588596.1 ABC transporter permease [Chloroflexota bacterium]MCY3685640.1 ABC transporter permease [Chloroflexota bacterium]MDE2708542.1 ABC transporter permease [Chloroflexota bacterium]MDE2987277.1 ABC transporter permease [Chloroflexota bacterium]
MRQYIIRRLLLIIPTMIGVTMLVSLLTQLLPGDFIDVMLADHVGAGEDKERIRAQWEEQLGWNDPWIVQYGNWLWRALQGDLGTSFIGSFQTVVEEIEHRVPVTLELGVLALIVGVAIALPVGIISAIRQDSALDYVIRGGAILALSVPGFWLAVLTIRIIFPELGLPPLPLIYQTPGENLAENLRQLYVPAIILGIGLAGPVMRLTRGEMLEVLRQDYVRTARAKGLQENAVIVRHAMRNALIPVLTLIGLSASILVGGSVIMESIFTLPGMGLRMITALKDRDIPVVMGIMVVIALVVILANLVIDIAYSLVDPRIRYN